MGNEPFFFFVNRFRQQIDRIIFQNMSFKRRVLMGMESVRQCL